ncbi:hypothetical protein J6590_050590 [Homalodisca vitripennis]|nr:hypothetical protein J6590_050590 [Homalodisca vitripennis]
MSGFIAPQTRKCWTVVTHIGHILHQMIHAVSFGEVTMAHCNQSFENERLHNNLRTVIFYLYLYKCWTVVTHTGHILHQMIHAVSFGEVTMAHCNQSFENERLHNNLRTVIFYLYLYKCWTVVTHTGHILHQMIHAVTFGEVTMAHCNQSFENERLHNNLRTVIFYLYLYKCWTVVTHTGHILHQMIHAVTFGEVTMAHCNQSFENERLHNNVRTVIFYLYLYKCWTVVTHTGHILHQMIHAVSFGEVTMAHCNQSFENERLHNNLRTVIFYLYLYKCWTVVTHTGHILHQMIHAVSFGEVTMAHCNQSFENERLHNNLRTDNDQFRAVVFVVAADLSEVRKNERSHQLMVQLTGYYWK